MFSKGPTTLSCTFQVIHNFSLCRLYFDIKIVQEIVWFNFILFKSSRELNQIHSYIFLSFYQLQSYNYQERFKS